MKNFMLAILFSLLPMSAYADQSSADAMLEFSKLAGSSIVDSHDYGNGFTFKKLKGKPLLKKVFREHLANKESELEKQFIDFVDHSGEFTAEDAKAAKKDPKGYLRVPYLYEIYYVFKVYKNKKFIGFAFECVNYVDAAIIQDGSWATVYVDTEQNVVTTLEGQS